jgi:hypothetical protein
MFGGTRFRRIWITRTITTLLFLSYAVGFIDPWFLHWSGIPHAEAAEVTIDPDVSITSSVHSKSGSNTVFIDDLTGYNFFVDAPNNCVYRKTTDGGQSWSGTTTVDSQTDCIEITVWYDKWTPGSASSSIHIATMDGGNDDIWYNRLDTNGDTLLLGSSPVSTFTGSGQGGTSLTTSENFTSITRGTDGTIYVISNDGSGTRDSAFLECTVSCQTNTNWTERTFFPLDDASDQNLLVPLTGGDIMQIQRDISLNDIRARIWDDSAGTGTAWTTIDANATVNTTYDHGLAAAVSSTTPGVVYIAYTANVATLGTDDQIRTARYNGTTWATSSNATSSTARGITNVAIGLDGANDDVYVAYSARTTPATAGTANVFWRKATSSMMNWGTESAAVNASQDDIYGVDLNPISDQRLYVSWYEAGPDDIFGDTIADIFPGVHASSTSTQTSSTTASSTNVYIGGKFLLYNTYNNASYDVTGITITESGTIDGFAGIGNVKLYYEMDTVAPYNCATNTYDGTESQFGSTDTNGFSGTDGVSSFTGTTVSLSTTTAMCAYVVLDVLDAAGSSTTIDISIADPTSDVTVTNSTAGPSTAQNISGTTFVYNDTPTQTHFHWRNDSGSEALATSSTSGVEDTALTALQQGTPKRLRLQVSNEGSTSTGNMQYRLEYGSTTGNCADTPNWVNVGDAGGEFDMFDSSFITDGADTTNIAEATGGVTDENTTFLTPNGGVRDTSSQTGNINLTGQQFVELEYSIVASTSAAEGNSYCFRVTNAGTPLYTYSELARANISADVLVTASGTQIATTNLPATNFYVGGKFVVVDNTGSRDVTSITIREDATVDGLNGLNNIRLYYDLDTSLPYDCASESYGGGELQFGATSTGGFSADNGTTTFTDSVNITTTQALCVYTVLDTTSVAQNGQVINIVMENPSVNLVVSTGSVSPTVDRDMTGSTTLAGPVLTQTHYHFRNDNGTQATATSLTNGIEDTAVSNIALTTPVRLRLQVSNEGAVAASSQTYQIEYGAKITNCASVSSWTAVDDAGGAWEMYDSIHMTNGTNTTNIAVASGGVTDENTTFIDTNGGVLDTSGTISPLTIATTEYFEAEYAMIQTTGAGFNTTYCFRLSQNGTALNVYSQYPELTTSPERDFEIQRNTTTFSATSTTLVAGVDYVAPSASTSAFVRITNTHYTGAGDAAAGGTQNADDVTAYIANASNITNSFTIQRPSTALATTTRVSWEIVEFIGTPGSDNEFIVRGQGSVTYGTTATTATGTAIAGITNDSDVVVFITGQLNPDTGTSNFNTGQSLSSWNITNDVPVFERGASGSDASIVSYAVVEFTGQNWNIQRSEHTYSSAGTTETEPITAVNATTRAFLHTQKLNGINASGTDEFGHEVWLSSMGFVSFFLEAGASLPSTQRSVAWVIENFQTSDGFMEVTRPPQGVSNGGVEPITVSASTTRTLVDLTNTSIFGNSRSAGNGVLYPRPIAGLTIASTTAFEVWRSDTGAQLTYRVEIVEWPTAGLALKHANHQFYADNNALDPTDPWPPGGTDIGENAVIGPGDDPLGEGDRLRLRMTLRVLNATLPTSTKAFKLQYAPLTTTCTAITESSWQTLGNSASSTIWRGYSATGTTDGTELSTNPPTAGDLNISGADVAGTLEEENDSLANPYSVPEGSDLEYDWYIEQNGASAETYYCFRMIESDGTLLSGYLPYPQVRTASFSPRTQDWRWYDDEYNLTPTTSLTGINSAPIDIANGDVLVLRITVAEIKNIARDDVRFKLQYSEYANFSTSTDLLGTSTCIASTSTWCYANASGTDNGVVSSTTLPDVDTCTLGVGDGCGTYNVTPTYRTGYRHENGAIAEYSFAIQAKYPRVNTVYYFRLYDLVQDIPVEINSGESYPSLVTEGASLTFSIAGVSSSTVTEGITTDIGATATSIPYGNLVIGNDVEAAHRLTVTTNAPEGYQLYLTSPSELTSASGAVVPPVTGTNQSPVGWGTGCSFSAAGCFGYHAGDDTLDGGSTRFAANDTYARFSTTTLDEVVYSSGPIANESVDMVYKVKATPMQAAGQYSTIIRYIAVPTF